MARGPCMTPVRMALLVVVWLLAASGAASPQDASPIDSTAWESAATRAGNAVVDARTTNLALEQIRAQMADWRATFLEAQQGGSERIDTIRSQIDALGPPPADGTDEAPEIAKRRKELTAIQERLQAPGRVAEEAFRRADGVIAEIDRVIRERQTDALMQLWPAPVNPANWPTGLTALSQSMLAVLAEVTAAWSSPKQREELGANLPAIVAYLTLALVLLSRGRRWMEMLARRLVESASARGRKVYALVASFGQVVLPLMGVYLLVEALRLTGMVGLAGDVGLAALPTAGFAIFAARWLALQIYPKGPAPETLLQLPNERRAEGRFHAGMLGLVLALDIVRRAVVHPVGDVEAATAVVSFPILVVAGILLFRTGQLLRLHVLNDDVPGEATNIRNRLIGVIGHGAMLVGLVGPVLAAVGYIAAATAIVFPAALSLGLIALLIVLQRLAADLYALIVRADEQAREALIPVLVNFALALLMVPVLALIWGARASDLAEIWARFSEGLTLGNARITPADVVVFAALFGLGYAVTRLFQGALRTSILPKTSIDHGGQNAIVSGVGYIGIFLAALIAITSVGIDLSSLAIVAGALSVGIGFGLQNIVSNFVSGIILLIERPVSEGDWIEVGGVTGRVRAIAVRSTMIEAFDHTDVIVPNADLITGMVKNWTRFNLSGRLIVPVAVAYGSDTALVEKILMEIAEDQPLVVLNPPPMVYFIAFGADALKFEVRVILRDVNFIMEVQSTMLHAINRRFNAEGIVFPFAQRDIWIRNPDALAAVVQAVPATAGPARPMLVLPADIAAETPPEPATAGPSAGRPRKPGPKA